MPNIPGIMKLTDLKSMLSIGAVLTGFFTVAALSGCGGTTAVPEKKEIPTIDQVGALHMPEEIAPVEAPFPMPEFRKPEFPDRSITITDRGAEENTIATAAIQGAVDELTTQGGGTVIVPAGQWLTGRITLKDNVNLHVSEGAELHFSGEIEDYLPAVFTRNEGIEVMSLGALIYANGADNIALTGKGKLVGPPMDCPVRKRVMNVGVIENVIDANTPVSERVYEGKDDGFIFLPMFIGPVNCTNVYVEGVTIERTPFWNVVPVYCDGVIIRGITVRSVGIPRGDGIDIESTRNVLIEYSTLSCGDDCFTMKAGRAEDGIRVGKPTENVVVRYCLAEEGHGAITCGSETAGMIRNLYVHDCVFENTGAGIRFKTRRNRSGGGDNLFYERIRMNLTGPAFVWDMLGSRTYVGELANRLPLLDLTPLTPSYRNIFVNEFIVEKSPEFIRVNGIPETPLTNVVIENGSANANKLIILRDVDHFTLRNVEVSTEQNTVEILDGRNIDFENVVFNRPIEVTVNGSDSRQIRFTGCTPELPEGWSYAEYVPGQPTE